MDKKKVLVIEDELALVDSLKVILELSGHEVIKATDGASAILAFTTMSSDIDLILCDINLPDISGLELLNYAKNSATLYQTPFIFLTAFADETDVRKGMNLGADDYLTKPFTVPSLISTINSRLNISNHYNKLRTTEQNQMLNKIFSNSFQHEYYTPLTNLQLLMDLLNSETDPPDRFAETVDAIRISYFRMYRNTRNLLTYANSQFHVDKQHYFMKKMASPSKMLKTILFNYKFISNKFLDVSAGNLYEALMRTDAANIIMTELLDNALKFAAFKSKVLIGIKPISDGFEFIAENITDHKPLNVAEIKPFTKFHADESLNGLGLGLYVVTQLCNQLGYHFTIRQNSNKFCASVKIYYEQRGAF